MVLIEVAFFVFVPNGNGMTGRLANGRQRAILGIRFLARETERS